MLFTGNQEEWLMTLCNAPCSIRKSSGQFTRLLVFLLFLCNILTAVSTITLAAEHQDNPQETTTPAKVAPPDDCCFIPYFGTHYYDVFFQNLLIGKATIEVTKEDDAYQVRVNAKTRSAITALYKITYKGEVAFKTNPITPINATIEEQSGSKSKKFAMNFAETEVSVTEIEKKGTQPAKIKEKEFSSENFVLDPFSTIYLIRSIAWKTGLTEIFDVITGNKHYELRLVCTGVTTVTINDENREAWVIQPQSRKVDEPDSMSEPGTWTILVSRDDMREILKIAGHPKIGRVAAQLRKFEKIF